MDIYVSIQLYCLVGKVCSDFVGGHAHLDMFVSHIAAFNKTSDFILHTIPAHVRHRFKTVRNSLKIVFGGINAGYSPLSNLTF